MDCYYLKNKKICPPHPTLAEHGDYEKKIVNKRNDNERNRIGKFEEDHNGIYLPLKIITLGGNQYYHNPNSNNVFDTKKNHIGMLDIQMNQIRVNDDNRDEED